MRCRNCHTVMMETDSHCPSCHATAASATAGPPESVSDPNAMLRLLPMCGGLMGGLLYAALAQPEVTVRPGRRCAPAAASGGLCGGSSGGPSPWKWVFGVGLILVGALLLFVAFVQLWQTWKIARREPKFLTADELCRLENSESPAWIAYSFAESKPTGLTVKRAREGHGGDVEARCLMVRAGDKWLAASVAPGFEGNTLVGRVIALDTASAQALIERARKGAPDPAAVLPFEFNAVDGSLSDLRLRYGAAACIAAFGLAGLVAPGYYLCRPKHPQKVRTDALEPHNLETSIGVALAPLAHGPSEGGSRTPRQ